MKLFYRIVRAFALVIGGLLAIALITFAIWNWRATNRLEAKLVELRAAGQPVRLADLARPAVPPDDNAATYLRRAKSDIDAIGETVFAAKEAEEEAQLKREEADPTLVRSENTDDDRPSPTVLAAMREALAAHPEALPVILRASQCPDLDFQTDLNVDVDGYLVANTKSMSTVRSAVRVLGYQAQIDLADDRANDVMNMALASFRLSRLHGREPTLVAHLVSLALCNMAIRIASDALRTGQVTPENHQALATELAAQDSLESAAHAFRTERAYVLDRYRDFALDFPGPIPWIMEPLSKQAACDAAELIELVIKSLPAPANDEAAGDAYHDKLARSSYLVAILEPAMQAVRSSMRRNLAAVRALRILSALVQDEAAANSEHPLAELGLPAEQAADPFDGQPLRLKKLPTGWIVYSVGDNLRDDGGDFVDNKDVGVGPPHSPSG